MNPDDTIAAISTAIGVSARIIIRLTGPQSVKIACNMADVETLAASSAQRAMLSFSDLKCPGWVYAFHAPNSYTGEDSIELHIPGNPVLAKILLDELYAQGARPAEPGEFTARAFFNGKLGLTQAEGVAATIAAGNEAELLAARQLIAGELAHRLLPITDQLAQTLALIEVGIDFSEEDVTFLASDEVARRIQSAEDSLEDLLQHSARFDQLTHDPRVVLVGRPNAGKSSLINALCGQNRAIVSDLSGTTRDVLTAEIYLKRGRVFLSDVAGLETAPIGNDPQAQIDRQMQTQARNAIESADHIVMLIDSTDDKPPLKLSREPDLVVRTKRDLNQVPDRHPGLYLVSSKTGEGLDDLRIALDTLVFGAQTMSTSLALNRRHLAAIADARTALSRAAARTIEGSPELVAMDLRDVLNYLGTIVGEVTPDDVLGRVFSAFCIGK